MVSIVLCYETKPGNPLFANAPWQVRCFCSGHCNLLALLVQLTYISRKLFPFNLFVIVCEEYACLQRHLPLVISTSWWMEPDIRAPVNMPKGTSCRRSTTAASPPGSGAAAGSK